METGRAPRWRVLARMTAREMATRVGIAVAMVAVVYGLFALSGKPTHPERVTAVIEEAFTAAEAGDRSALVDLFCDREAADRAYELITGPPRLHLQQVEEVEIEYRRGFRRGSDRGPRDAVAIVAVRQDRVAVPAGVSRPEQRQLYLRIPAHKRAKSEITWRLCDATLFAKPDD